MSIAIYRQQQGKAFDTVVYFRLIGIVSAVSDAVSTCNGSAG